MPPSPHCSAVETNIASPQTATQLLDPTTYPKPQAEHWTIRLPSSVQETQLVDYRRAIMLAIKRRSIPDGVSSAKSASCRWGAIQTISGAVRANAKTGIQRAEIGNINKGNGFASHKHYIK